MKEQDSKDKAVVQGKPLFLENKIKKQNSSATVTPVNIKDNRGHKVFASKMKKPVIFLSMETFTIL